MTSLREQGLWMGAGVGGVSWCTWAVAAGLDAVTQSQSRGQGSTRTLPGSRVHSDTGPLGHSIQEHGSTISAPAAPPETHPGTQAPLPLSNLTPEIASSPSKTSTMGISRDSRHKRAHTGAKRAHYRKKRKFELGRQPASTKLGAKRIHVVRVRGGNIKHRALRLDTGNFSWGSESITRRTRMLDVVYNASNNELVRTKTLVKNAIIQIDATPFRQWYETHYGLAIKKRGGAAAAAAAAASEEPKKESNSLKRKHEARAATAKLDTAIEDQFTTGRLYGVFPVFLSPFTLSSYPLFLSTCHSQVHSCPL